MLLKIKLHTGVVLLVKRMACACCRRKWAARRCLAVPFSASFNRTSHISESLQMHRRPNHVGDCRGTQLLSTEETQDLPLIMNGQICVFLFQLQRGRCNEQEV